MIPEELKILERYCAVAEECARLEKEKKRLREIIDGMGLQAGFAMDLERGSLSVTEGPRRLLIVDISGLARRLGKRFFAENVFLPIGKLQESFRKDMIGELERQGLAKMAPGNPVLRFRPLKGQESARQPVRCRRAAEP